uniref:Uncharacterized protein n=1 Tax=Grammatophora oceanica TaxID=210454 RepID=A0A7S1ULR0_9STRA
MQYQKPSHRSSSDWTQMFYSSSPTNFLLHPRQAISGHAYRYIPWHPCHHLSSASVRLPQRGIPSTLSFTNVFPSAPVCGGFSLAVWFRREPVVPRDPVAAADTFHFLVRPPDKQQEP